MDPTPPPQQPADSGAVTTPPWLPGTEVTVDPLPGTPAPPAVGRRRSRARVTAIVVCAVLVVLSLAVMVGEWATRTAEADALLDQIERSEAAMITAMGTVSATLEQEGAYDGGLTDAAAEQLREAADAAHREVVLSSDAMSSIAIMSWHSDIAAARDAYLQHSAVWRDFLARAGLEPTSWFVEDPSIASTWDVFTAALPDVVTTPDVRSLNARVQAIVDEGADEGGEAPDPGSTLQALGSQPLRG